MKTVTLGFIRERDMSLCYSSNKYQYYLDEETNKFYKIKRDYVRKVLDAENADNEKMYEFILSLKSCLCKI